MPIEIKELHIRVAVDSTSNTNSTGDQPPIVGSIVGCNAGWADNESLVAKCVEQVLEILQTKKER